MGAYFRILAYGRPYLRYGLLAFGALVMYSLFNVISLFSVAPFLRILFDRGNPVPPPGEALRWYDPSSLKGWFNYVLDQRIEAWGPMRMLAYFCAFLLVAIIIKAVFRYLSAYFMAPLEQGVIREMRGSIFRHLTEIDIAYFSRRRKGDLLGIATSDVQVIQEAVIGTLQSTIRDPLLILTLFISMLFLSWQLTLFTLILLPLTGLLINLLSKWLKRGSRRGQEALGRLVGVLEEFLGGVRVVKAFGKESYERHRYNLRNTAYFRLLVKLRRQSELASPITEVLSVAVICGIILFSGSLILRGRGLLTPEQFILFIVLFSQFIDPLRNLSTAISKISKGTGAFERVEELLHVPNRTLATAHITRSPQLLKSLRFEGVSFAYDTPESEREWVLRDVSFTLPVGQTLALVGPSGGGKSTLADLILRFYDPLEGQILLDETPIDQISLPQLRDIIGYVGQEPVLFHSSVLQNIAYGDPTPNRERAEEAARIANAEDFIRAMPRGYSTLVGERGGLLSGGQRQRIAIARAVYRDPELLILDEATSSLDTESERLVQDALERLLVGRTALVIAHRLSTIRGADQILVLEGGKIVDRGRHEELIARGGTYGRLHGNSQ